MVTKPPDIEKIRERDVEKRLVRKIKAIGGKAYKFRSPNNRSVPDRLCIFEWPNFFFVECKAPGKEPTPAQWEEINRLRERKFVVYIIDTYEKVDLLMKQIEVLWK